MSYRRIFRLSAYGRWLVAALFCCAALPAWAALVDNSDGTVTDTVTQLIWDKCSLGQTWDGSSPAALRCSVGLAAKMTPPVARAQPAAVNATNHRGHDDWRLPNLKELDSLIKIDAVLPPIDTTAFPGTPSSWFCSSTSPMLDRSRSYQVEFTYGQIITESTLCYVRLVRGGQATAAYDGADVIPAAFTFAALIDQMPNTPVVSDMTVTGITVAVPIGITGGEYQVNGGAWTSSAGTVNNGDVVAVRHTTSASYASSVNTVLTLSGGAAARSATFSSTTGVRDIVPDTFAFSDLANQPLNTLVTSNSITISGINDTVSVSVLGGEYSLDSGPWTNVAGTVNNGSTVRVRHTTRSGEGLTANTVLAVGDIFDVFSSTTQVTIAPPVDGVCGSSHGTVIREAPTGNLCSTGYNSGVTSSSASFTWNCHGWSGGAVASCSAAHGYLLTPLAGANGRLAPATVQTVAWNSTFTITATPDSGYIVQTLAGCNGTRNGNSLTIASVNGDCTVSAGFVLKDTLPDPFSFVAQNGVAVGVLVNSDTITVGGTNAEVPISISNGEYRIGNGAWTSSPGTINNGESVQVRHISSPAYGGTVTTVLAIGGISADFSSTTRGEDNMPDPFAFAPQSGALPNTVATSNAVTISGINVPALMTVSGGMYSLDGGDFTSDAALVRSGQRVRAQVISAAEYSGSATAMIRIGSGSGNFTVTTYDGVSPWPFGFTTVRHALRSTVVESDTAVLTGFSSSKALTVSGGEVSINDGAWGSGGKVSAGAAVKVRLTSSALPGRVVRATVTVGTTSATFAVVTRGGLPAGVLMLLLD